MTATGLFNRLRQTRAAVVRRIGITALLAMVGAFELCGFVGLRINGSPSLPIGLYVSTSDPHANLVEFCPAEPFASFAIERGYRSKGICPDGGAPLLKPIVARAGEVVDLSAQGIAVNGRQLPNTNALIGDYKGRSLVAWPAGRYVVAPNTVWVASSYNQRSFDSRYFGPVATSSVRNRVRPLLTLP